jgi:predicted nucleic acid-binding protein
MPENYFNSVVIADTSCLIAFTNIGMLELLHTLCKSIVITPEVAMEYGESLPAWMQVAPVASIATQATIQETLDLGESSAIALALETPASLLVIDEARGRRFAEKLGLNITGTLGLLIEASHRGLIIDAQVVLDKLRQHKFRIPHDAEKLFGL